MELGVTEDGVTENGRNGTQRQRQVTKIVVQSSQLKGEGSCRLSGISEAAVTERCGSELCLRPLRSLLFWLREMSRPIFPRLPVFNLRS